MRSIFKDEMFQAQWLRTAGHASSGGADLGECLAIAGRIRERDPVSWYKAWTEAADAILRAARASLADGRKRSALDGFLRASNYFRAGYTFLMGAPVDRRVLVGYRAQRAAFAAATELMARPAQAVRIAFGEAALPGYFLRGGADRRPRPTLIVTGGYDGTAEESFFYSGAAAIARGYNVVLYDGPGQGGAIIEDGMVFRPDWEKVAAAVVNFAVTRPEVDPTRIALMGLSFGGYLAARAATGEPRLAALVCDPGEYSLFEEMRSRLPAFVARRFPDGNAAVLRLFNALMKRRAREPTEGWPIRRGLWVHGVPEPLDYLRMTRDYTVAGLVERIACPTAVCSAEDDVIGVTARKLYDALRCEKTFFEFRSSEGAGAHCEAGARLLFNQRIFDWLDGIFER